MPAARLEVHLPVFNEETYLPQMLECLARQTFKDFRVVIHDNGSTDATPDICRRAAQSDSRIRINRCATNSGALAQGLRFRYGCDAQYVATRSANDLIADEYFEKTLQLLESDATIALAYSYGLLIDDIGAVVAVPNATDRMDTRGAAGPVERATSVMRQYGYSFPLWGVYRRDALERTRPPQHCYGNDHVEICELALYGNIVSTEEKLDFRRISRNELNFYPDGVKSWARHYSEEHARGVPAGSPYSSVAVHLPFTNMIWGHIEMISLAQIDENLKPALAEAAIEIIYGRFGAYIQNEVMEFLTAARTEFPAFLDELSKLPRHLRAMRLGKLQAELNKLTIIPCTPLSDLAALNRKLANIAGAANA